MSSCNLDHPNEDVRKKLEDQKNYLPEDLYEHSILFLNQSPTQSDLNELFHLLKKYDLSSEKEKNERNKSIKSLVQS
ncbi:group-specific protein [Halobacillus seohaensis]|uniref:Group-specific protein n=1 Tax=Halobacillus seohaensis TaxID=447421 RepID=A0ABW2EH22_9BACI